MYRPSNANIICFNQAFDDLMDVLICKNNLVLIGGNLNIDLLKTHDLSPASDFFNILKTYHLYPSMSLPTRITDTSATLIDNICISCLDPVDNILARTIFHNISVHLLILVPTNVFSHDMYASFHKHL